MSCQEGRLIAKPRICVKTRYSLAISKNYCGYSFIRQNSRAEVGMRKNTSEAGELLPQCDVRPFSLVFQRGLIGNRRLRHQTAEEVRFDKQLRESEWAGRLNGDSGKDGAAGQEEPAFRVFQAQSENDANHPVKQSLGPIAPETFGIDRSVAGN